MILATKRKEVENRKEVTMVDCNQDKNFDERTELKRELEKESKLIKQQFELNLKF